MYKANNKLGWSGTPDSKGSLDKNVWVLTIGDDAHIFPNLAGNAYKKKTDNPHIHAVALVWMSGTLGKDVEKLKMYRQSVIDKINDLNHSHLLQKGIIVIDEVVFVGQTVKNQNKLLTSKKDSNGAFTTKFA